MNKKKMYALICGVLIIGAVIWVFAMKNSTDYTSFAQCLTEKDAKMYGAWWCPHCQAQKKAFGDSWSYVTYVECSTQDGKQTQACKDANIQGYPTWRFADGTELAGEATFEELAQRTGCVLN